MARLRSSSATVTTRTDDSPVLTSPIFNTGISGSAILDEDNLAGDSDTKLATQQSIKAYVDGVGVQTGADAQALGTGNSPTFAGATLTGAITTNSTFDGRDVAADGTKLDGIEASATADQTAAQLLTAIKTVDGSGSGLDADLLDGAQGSSYLLKSGGAMTGAITTNSTFDGRDVATDGTKLDGIEASATADQTAAQLLTAIKTVDGSGSGLDADLLDGLDWGSATARRKLGLSALTTYDRNTGSTTARYHTGVMGWGAIAFNTILGWGAGFFDTWSSPANSPSAEASHWQGHQALHYTDSGNYHHGYQFAVGAGNPAFCYLRGWWANGGSGYAWAKMWNAANDGSGSGLDADLLDGVQGSSYLLKSGGAMTGNISFPAGQNIIRTTHSSGFLEGSYNNVGGNESKTNPIYTIGSSYNPTDTALSNMYGIGYSHTNLTGMIGGGWGMYVAADGDVRIGLSGSTGEIRATGNITAYYSDERLKDFDGKIDNALDKVMKLNGYYFTENAKAKELGYSNDRRQVGVSAQEVEAVLPEVVTEAPMPVNDEDYKTVWYDKLVPLLIEAIKEQQTQINELKSLIKKGI
jgi:hypothetical protein